MNKNDIKYLKYLESSLNTIILIKTKIQNNYLIFTEL